MGTSITRKIKEYANIEVYGPYAPMGLKNSSWQSFIPKIPKISKSKRVFCPASVTSRFCIRESFLEETRIVQKQEKRKLSINRKKTKETEYNIFPSKLSTEGAKRGVRSLH